MTKTKFLKYFDRPKNLLDLNMPNIYIYFFLKKKGNTYRSNILGTLGLFFECHATN